VVLPLVARAIYADPKIAGTEKSAIGRVSAMNFLTPTLAHVILSPEGYQ
jgi:hypothetical protein